MKQKLLLVLITGLPVIAIAQKKITISGYAKDALTKEALIGATVANANNKTGTATNEYGFFSITALATDTVEIIISYQGYKLQAKKIIAKENIQIEVLLENAVNNLSEVIVTGNEISISSENSFGVH